MNLANYFTKINTKEVLNNLPDAVFVIDSDGKIVWINDKTSVVFEEQKSNLTNYYFYDLVSNGLELAAKSANNKNSVVTAAFTPDNKEFFIEMNAKKYGEQYFITIRDITAMTNILAAAEKSGRMNKEKNTMLVKLSNEFKSPVQSISGFSQALLDGLGGEINEKQSKYIKIINKNSEDLLFFLEKFLEFSKIESSLYTYVYSTFDLINTIQSVIKNNELEATSKKLSISYNCDELEKRVVFSDENAIKTILQNVIETSIKLTDIGTISININHPDIELLKKSRIVEDDCCINDLNSFVHIAITDTGVGLAESEIQDIFEPYVLLDRPNKKNIIRSISLASATALASNLKGRLWIESQMMKGTTFNIILPIEKEIEADNE